MKQKKHHAITRQPIVPGRVRTTRGQTFAFISHRFLRDGFLCSITPDQLRLYVFLILAADRNGLSFYSFERICSVLEMDFDQFLDARDHLIRKDLIAFDGTRFQVLSLPPHPICPASQVPRHNDGEHDDDPVAVREAILSSLAQADKHRR